MMKKYVIPIFLCTIISSIQANQANIQEQTFHINLAGQDRLDIIDDIISLLAGGGGAWLVGTASILLARLTTNDGSKLYAAGLGSLVLYGALSAKLANEEEGQKKKMFGRGGIIGAGAMSLNFISMILFYRSMQRW